MAFSHNKFDVSAIPDGLRLLVVTEVLAAGSIPVVDVAMARVPELQENTTASLYMIVGKSFTD